MKNDVTSRDEPRLSATQMPSRWTAEMPFRRDEKTLQFQPDFRAEVVELAASLRTAEMHPWLGGAERVTVNRRWHVRVAALSALSHARTRRGPLGRFAVRPANDRGHRHSMRAPGEEGSLPLRILTGAAAAFLLGMMLAVLGAVAADNQMLPGLFNVIQ